MLICVSLLVGAKWNGIGLTGVRLWLWHLLEYWCDVGGLVLSFLHAIFLCEGGISRSGVTWWMACI